MSGSPKDVCLCGDYRENHKQRGAGPCQICDYAGPTKCQRFRFWKKSDG